MDWLIPINKALEALTSLGKFNKPLSLLFLISSTNEGSLQANAIWVVAREIKLLARQTNV